MPAPYSNLGSNGPSNLKLLVISIGPSIVRVLNSLSTTTWRRIGEQKHSYSLLDLCIRWKWVISLASWPLYPGEKSFRYWLNRRMDGLQSRSKRRGKEISCPAVQRVARRDSTLNKQWQRASIFFPLFINYSTANKQLVIVIRTCRTCWA
jgi:hypothetical protein